MKWIPPEFWPEIRLDDDETPDYAAIFLECAIVFLICLLVAAVTGLLAGLVWGRLA